mmetsp:Transcript_23507/g.34493  ORF Transcript_23507/g.34493 Transcript_23507/m.34493 type:complete len:226 (+) Transcript_23507:216-893(+)
MLNHKKQFKTNNEFKKQNIISQFSHRMQSTLFQLQLMTDRIVEHMEYKDCNDPTLRELFWDRIDLFRQFIEKNLLQCYYDNAGDCVVFTHFLQYVFDIITSIHSVMDRIFTPRLDGLVRTNLRVLHKKGLTDEVRVVQRLVNRSGASYFVKTSKLLDSIREENGDTDSQSLPKIRVNRRRKTEVFTTIKHPTVNTSTEDLYPVVKVKSSPVLLPNVHSQFRRGCS